MSESARPPGSSLFGLLILVLAVGAASQWWSGHRQADVGQAVATLAQPGDIRMLSSETCSVCASARAWFEQHKIAFSECQIERDAACRESFNATGSPGTPVMLVRGQVQIGFDPGQIQDVLKKGG
jgi:glutaredoxin